MTTIKQNVASSAPVERPVMREYSEAVCGDGAAILCDGEPMPIELIVARLANFEQQAAELAALRDILIRSFAHMEGCDLLKPNVMEREESE